MKKNHFFSTDNKILFLACPLIILVCCLYYIYVVYTGSILPGRQVNYFQSTYCFLLEKKLSIKTDGNNQTLYRSDFYVSYKVDGMQFASWVSGNGLDLSYSKNQHAENAMLSQFNPGRNYHCWYDPANPKRVALVVRHQWSILFFLYIPVIISIMISYFLLKKGSVYLRYFKGVALATKNRNN